mgnify:CR=1 FL=1
MGNQFDETTECKSEEYSNEVAKRFSSVPDNRVCRHDVSTAAKYGWCIGRNSTKASMKEMAQDLVKRRCKTYVGVVTPGREVRVHSPDCPKCKLIAAVKANGDWPLEEK